MCISKAVSAIVMYTHRGAAFSPTRPARLSSMRLGRCRAPPRANLPGRPPPPTSILRHVSDPYGNNRVNSHSIPAEPFCFTHRAAISDTSRRRRLMGFALHNWRNINASTLAPQAGVFSLHFIFRDQAHLAKALADPAIAQEFRAMIKDQVQGAQVLGLLTMGMRNMYSKKEVKSIDDVKGQKVRVQATKTEDTLFPAYGAQTVHMPFGEVYTSLQTGVVNVAENGVNVYLANKHYEVAPVLSMTEHEANNNCIWVSDKTWNSLTPEQQKWVQAAADEVSKTEPAMALKLEKDSADKLKTIGVKVVENVDKAGFIKAAQPIQDQLAQELGPHAVKLLKLVRDVK